MRTGDSVSENEPFCTRFIWTGAVSQGRIRKVRMDVYADNGGGRFGREAPVCRDDAVGLVCHVEADLSHIPEDMLKRRKGSDGNLYYDLECKIEAVCKSVFFLCTKPCLCPRIKKTLHAADTCVNRGRSVRVDAVHADIQQPEV